MGTVLVEFADTGERVTCSFRAIRRLDERQTNLDSSSALA
jgi:hypothetical protein